MLNSRRYQEAITELEAILELRSNDALALNNLAVAQAMTNRFDDALKTLSKAHQNAGTQKVHEIGYVFVFASRPGGLRSMYSLQPEDAPDAFSHDNHRLHTLKLPIALQAGDSMSQHLFDPKKVRVSERTPVNSLSYWIELNTSALR